MRFHVLVPAVALGTALFAVGAQAAPAADYQALRAKTPVTTLKTTDHLSSQFPKLAGKVVELEGAVSGIITEKDSAGFLLQTSPGEALTVVTPAADPDIAIGNSVRVLARIPENGTLLQGMAVMKAGAETTTATAQQDAAKSAATDAQPAKDTAKTADGTEDAAIAATPAPKAEAKSAKAKAKASKADTASASIAPTARNIAFYAEKIRQFSRGVSPSVATTISTHVLQKSQKYGVDPRLIFALLAQESNFNPRAVSPVGAQGLGQLMPGTAAQLGVRNPFDVAQNIDGTIRYFAQQMKKFGGSVKLALAAYNAGPGNVTRYGGVPPFRETQNYVNVISKRYSQLAGDML